MSAYQKDNGKWYDLVQVDAFSQIEREVPAPPKPEKVEPEKPAQKAK